MNFPSFHLAMRQLSSCLRKVGKRIALSIGFFAFSLLVADTNRIPWVTSNVKGRPGQRENYQIKAVHPQLNFNNPVELVAMPGSDLMWMVELRGAIYSFSNQRTDSDKHQVIHLKSVESKFSSAYGLAFHPQFTTNRQVYLCYVVGGNAPNGTRVSRFKVTRSNPPKIIEESEEILITWKGGGHNGGCLKFGPDGYLYISTGDASGPNPPDIYNTGQDNSDLLSAILRIDVDRKGDGLSYTIPKDNPFVNIKDARPEIWAFGFRNPFKMSFDLEEGDLWVGDVGWELWELIFRIKKGGNYGWSIMEGNHEIQPSLRKGPGDFQPPIVEHPHSEAASITGGFVYRGTRIPELSGAYLYGDWETGKIWGLRQEQDRVTWQEELVDTSMKIITFGEDHDGELYVVDYAGGLYELQPNHEQQQQVSFPTTLGTTGLFADVAKHQMAAGVYPYEVEMQPWENGATAKRWIGLPDLGKVVVKDRLSVFPKNAVILKTLFWPDADGEEGIGLPIESQLLHFDGQTWNAYTYAWEEEGGDGLLVEKEGKVVTEEEQGLMAGSLAKTGDIDYWKFSSRSDCLRCHNSWSGFALGWNSLQLQGTSHASVTLKTSWDTINQLELVGSKKPKAFKQSAAMNELEYQAKSYLHANCAHCHRENAGGMVNALMYFEKPTEKASLIGSAPIRGSFDLDDPKVIAPGDPFNSILYYRMAKSGSGQMPHLGRTHVDVEGLDKIFKWISSMSNNKGMPVNVTSSVTDEVKTILEENDSSKMENRIDKLLSNSLGAVGLAYAIDHNWLSPTQTNLVKESYQNLENSLSRELLSKYFEKDVMSRNQIKIEEILALKPNLENGERLFFEDPSLECSTCHTLNGRGKMFGPDLNGLSKKYTSNQILEHITNPSKVVEPEYMFISLEIEDGFSLSGIIIDENDVQLHLIDIMGERYSVLKSLIIDRQKSLLSAMPEGLLVGKKEQEVRDLIGFLIGSEKIHDEIR